jgi:hypothetical protein
VTSNYKEQRNKKNQSMHQKMELQIIQKKIHEIRGQRVMIDFDLAEMYCVDTRSLKQAVKRNESRFPPDFMFELTRAEWEGLISQFVISNRGGNRFLPYAFTEQGVAMLSSVLRSEKAIEINIQIIRAFILIRQNTLLLAEINQKLENFMLDTNLQFNEIYLALQELAVQKATQRNAVGYLAISKND